MSLLFVEGFDASDTSLKWNGGSFSGFTSTTRFGSGKAIDIAQGAGIGKRVPATSQIYVGYAYYQVSPGSSGGVVLQGDSGATSHITVDITNTQVELRSGNAGSLIASAAFNFVTATWNYIEVMATVATSGGRCQVRLNGVLMIDFTGNTMNGGTNTTTDAISLVSNGGFANHGYFDDLYVLDTSGTSNNSFLGDVRVQTLVPNGVGSSTQFSPTGSANNWSNVNDLPDSASTYNSSAIVGNRDTYAMGDVLASTGTIFGVQDNIHAFKTDSGSANMKPALLSGPTLAYDTALVLTPSNIWTGSIRETDPNTGTAWTPAAINAVEYGGEVA